MALQSSITASNVRDLKRRQRAELAIIKREVRNYNAKYSMKSRRRKVYYEEDDEDDTKVGCCFNTWKNIMTRKKNPISLPENTTSQATAIPAETFTKGGSSKQLRAMATPFSMDSDANAFGDRATSSGSEENDKSATRTIEFQNETVL